MPCCPREKLSGQSCLRLFSAPSQQCWEQLGSLTLISSYPLRQGAALLQTQL